MEQNERTVRLALRIGAIAAGNISYALAVVLFIIPNGLITGGTTGLALFFNRTAGIPVSLFAGVFNIGMFLLGAWFLGRSFAVTTIVSTLLYPLALGMLQGMGLKGFYMEEKLAAVIYAGILIGAGIGMVMRAGASTGGMDIPPLILKKRFGWNVSFMLYLLDCLILGLQVIASDWSAILYGILLVIAYTIVLDQVLLSGSTRTQVKIVTEQYEALNRLLTERLDCGTSLLDMETGYLHRKQKMILAVIARRELPRLNQLVAEADPEAFMVISQVNEVKGRGFTLKKVYRKAAG